MNEAAPTRPAGTDAGLLSLRAISKRFGRTQVLDGVDLDVATGSFLCLIGPSGCGKTTLLRVLCGLEAPDEGRILRNGVELTHMTPAARGMGLVFQSYALFPNLRVDQNIAYGLPRGLRRRERAARVEMLLETVGLAGLGKRRPDELSGGQQQRVAIARAMAPAPSILLLDEPLSALDAQVRMQVRSELKTLQRRLGVTTIMVTHDQIEALAIADRIAVMQAGRIVQVGPPCEVYRAPASRFVAGFLGRMNFLRGTVVDGETVRLASGEQVTAAVAHLAPATPVDLAIRPEHVGLVAGEDRRAGHLRLRIVAREFFGAAIRLQATDGTERAEPVLIDLPARHGLAADGTEIAVHLPRDHLHIFAAGS